MQAERPREAREPGSRPDTRRRILEAARALFAQPGGYRATSMRQIAEQLGVTKAALYYHFGSKDDILRCITDPLLGELEGVLEAAAAEPELARVRWRLIEGSVTRMLAHRDVLVMLLLDSALLSETEVGARLGAILLRSQDLVAGPDADIGQRIRAFQLISGQSNTITRFAGVPSEVLRVHLLQGARVVLDGLGTPAPSDASADDQDADGQHSSPPARRGRPRGRGGGRPPALGRAEIDLARQRYQAGQTVGEIAHALGVSRATVYRHLATSRSDT